MSRRAGTTLTGDQWVGSTDEMVWCDEPDCHKTKAGIRYKVRDLPRHKAAAHGIYSDNPHARKARVIRDPNNDIRGWVLTCETCGYTENVFTQISPAEKMNTHTLAEHGRRPTDAERIPTKAVRE